MKAISIRQPWPWAILHAGKRVENRDWYCSYRGPILLHAAKGMTRQEYEYFQFFWEYDFPGHEIGKTYPKLPPAEKLAKGGIVGRANIIACVRDKDAIPVGKTEAWAEKFVRPWFTGIYGLILDDVEPLEFVPYRGALGLFEVPDDVVRAAA